MKSWKIRSTWDWTYHFWKFHLTCNLAPTGLTNKILEACLKNSLLRHHFIQYLIGKLFSTLIQLVLKGYYQFKQFSSIFLPISWQKKSNLCRLNENRCVVYFILTCEKPLKWLHRSRWSDHCWCRQPGTSGSWYQTGQHQLYHSMENIQNKKCIN